MSRTRWLVSLLLVVAVSVVAVSTNTNTTKPDTPARPLQHIELQSSHIVPDVFLVGFARFLAPHEARSLLDLALTNATTTTGHHSVQWEMVHRNNAASEYPSDFGVIKLTGLKSAQQQVVRSLSAFDGVRYVIPEKRFEGALLWNDDENEQQQDDVEELLELRRQPRRGVAEPSLVGRVHANFPMDDEYANPSTGRRLASSGNHVTDLLEADYFWQRGFKGAGVRVAIFDTGLGVRHPHFKNVRERTDWTDEHTLEDHVGHGTFVAGVVAGTEEMCAGFAPEVDLYIFRVFTNSKVSYTSWFLDAFNYAIHSEIDILNLSIGGPDFMDRPFVEKVNEMSANNIIVVSAIGNDGPLYGTLNNPADMPDVIGVGGIDFMNQLAHFSSRGMTLWELPGGYGRVKPDIVAYGKNVVSSKMYGGCRSLSGTSVASPVVAGAIALLTSAIPAPKRDHVNPASMKQALIESASLVSQNYNIFEQGHGRIDIVRAYNQLLEGEPRASLVPSSLDLTSCPFMWPFCAQPLYHTAMPLALNVTILNSMGVSGKIERPPQWVPAQGYEGILEVGFSYSDILWPWTGFLAVHLSVTSKGAAYDGEVMGVVTLTVTSPRGSSSALGSSVPSTSLTLPIKVRVIPTPPRSQRLLWDQYHSLHYPLAYFPRDVLWQKLEPFDWNGDHIHTNFRSLFTQLRSHDYYIEVLGKPLTCFDASNYGALLLVDTEDEFFPAELEKLRTDVTQHGLSVVVVADWYNTAVIEKIKFFDENTQEWWIPGTGGANVPALNDLLTPFGITLGDVIYDGELSLEHHFGKFLSGVGIRSFPEGGVLLDASVHDQGAHFFDSQPANKVLVPVAGICSGETALQNGELSNNMGRIAVLGDSSCLDDAHGQLSCDWLLIKLLKYACEGRIDSEMAQDGRKLQRPLIPNAAMNSLPQRRVDSGLYKHSRVIGNTLPTCSGPAMSVGNSSIDISDILWQRLVYLSENIKQQPPPHDYSAQAKGAAQANVLPYVLFVVLVVVGVVILLRKRKEVFAANGVSV